MKTRRESVDEEFASTSASRFSDIIVRYLWTKWQYRFWKIRGIFGGDDTTTDLSTAEEFEDVLKQRMQERKPPPDDSSCSSSMRDEAWIGGATDTRPAGRLLVKTPSYEDSLEEEEYVRDRTELLLLRR